MRLFLLHLVTVCACILSAPLSAAQTAVPPPLLKAPLSESLPGPAKEAYEAAVALVNIGDWSHAIIKYWQAYDLSKDARLLFDIAVCYRDLRAYAKMQSMLLRFEKEAGAGISAEQKADVDAALAAIHGLVGTVILKVSEAGADVSVDAEPAGTTPLAAPLLLDLGKHALRVTKDTFEPAERTIDIVGGNGLGIEITLVPQVRPALLRVAAGPAATILIDNKALARGTFDGSLAPGTHQIQVTEPGKKSYEARIVLGNGEARSLDVTLESEQRAALWPWIAGGAAVLAGGGIGAYFLLRQDSRTSGQGLSGLQGQPLFTVKIPPGAH
ncbi:MAG TPA: PEGA domain-containing protein [Polyangiaceae bacterium]|nr:PEGA domain-containing protein [Polyangiaceae bacterium]